MKKLYRSFYLLAMILSGCCDDMTHDKGYKNKTKLGLRQLAHKPEMIENVHMLHRHFTAAGIGSIYGLFFVKDISHDDKILIEDNIQAALDADEDRQWQGITVSGVIEIGQKYVMNGFMCREFKHTFIFADNSYVVSNKACKIYLNKDGSGYWVLEDSVENYMSSENIK